MEIKNKKDDIIITTKKISKVYPGTRALDNVNYKVYRGKVNGLIGANGAGKSTLMKILAGIEEPSSGRYLLNGEEVSIKNPREAAAHGIGIIHQELNLFSNLNIAENLFATREITKHGIHIDHKEQERKATILLEKLEHSIDPKTLVGNLRVGEQQIVEIAKVLSQEIEILIMDEPTSALSKEEVAVLFKIIDELKKQNITIIYISHRLEELMQIGDHLTILRDGELVAESEVKDIDIPWIIKNMVGNDPDFHKYIKHDNIGEKILEGNSISLEDRFGKQVLKDVTFHLKKGEVLGLYGLRGAGRTELLECLIGSQPDMSGEIYIEGDLLKSKSVDESIRHGIALVPEDRQREGLFRNLSIQMNMSLSSLSKYTKWIHIFSKKEETAVSSKIDELAIKIANKKDLIGSLSGGNQQKVVIGKGLLTQPKVLLMDETTRGIDVKAKQDVFAIMNKLANEGLSIIYVSTEVDEIMAVSDRILVFSKGEITGEFSRDNVKVEQLVAASAVGHEVSTSHDQKI